MTGQSTSDLLEPRRLHLALLVLSFGAGATDAFAFLALGGIFTANMTGNLVLAGLVGRQSYLDTLLGALVAVFAFVVTLCTAFRYIRRSPHTSHRTSAALLVVGATTQFVILVLWSVCGLRTGVVTVDGLVALSAAAMACQTVVAREATAAAGLTTTFVTGTIVGIVDDLARGHAPHLPLRIGAIITLVTGSLACAGLIIISPVLGPVLPVAAGCVALVAVGARWKRLQPR